MRRMSGPLTPPTALSSTPRRPVEISPKQSLMIHLEKLGNEWITDPLGRSVVNPPVTSPHQVFRVESSGKATSAGMSVPLTPSAVLSSIPR